MDTRWKHPFNCIVAGPSQSGKTHFALKFARELERLVVPTPREVLYCYAEYQSVFADYPEITFHAGLPDPDELRSDTLVIVDDFLGEGENLIEKLFVKLSHHRGVSVLYLTQNLFYKKTRTASLNTHYMVLFKNPRDAGQVTALGRQVFPGRSKFLLEAYTDATSRPFGYLILDLKADTLEQYRVRTGIFSDEIPYAYIPK